MTLAAELGPEVGGPQALRAHLVLERVDDRARISGVIGTNCMWGKT